MFQLQVLFAFLQTSQQGVYDPSTLVKALNLDSGEQQDSQEFSKLFVGLLDHEFKKQGAKREQNGLTGVDVAQLVPSQFEGKMVYGTRCDRCQTKSERTDGFLELEVTLKPNCKLQERISATLRDEELEGENQ